MKKDTKNCMMPSLFTVSLGTKGQIVIPKEARESIGLGIGDKIVLMAAHDHIMLMPADNMQHFIQMMQEQLKKNE